jgi:hypothetical protein
LHLSYWHAELYLQGCDLEGPIPAELGNCVNMLQFHAYQNYKLNGMNAISSTSLQAFVFMLLRKSSGVSEKVAQGAGHLPFL